MKSSLSEKTYKSPLPKKKKKKILCNLKKIYVLIP